MTKLSELKRGLKSADKRRKRRGVVATPPQVPSSREGSQVDVMGLVVGEVLKIASADEAVDDRSLVAALRCIAQQRRSTRPAVAMILGGIEAKAAEQSVSPQKLRQAVSELLAMAGSYDTLSSSSPFLGYLAMVAG